MRKSRQDFQKYVEEVLRRTGIPKRPPTPLYQKVVLSVLMLGTLVGLIAVLFFR